MFIGYKSLNDHSDISRHNQHIFVCASNLTASLKSKRRRDVMRKSISVPSIWVLWPQNVFACVSFEVTSDHKYQVF